LTGPPADAADDKSWPLVLRGAVQAYGADVIYAIGLEVLGYPPTLCHQVGESNRVMAEVQKRSKQSR